ncbi:MAG: hypothetical protein DPW09_08600 [Anaerolineae bacterium]|nr:hypothetical protein [Anaerolineae bacterium]
MCPPRLTKKSPYSRYSTFFETDLDTFLSSLNPDVIVVCGVNTHACVRTTVIISDGF